jgi:hypothetical protein
MALILEVPVTEWYCPNCGLTDQTKQAGPHTRFHTCPRLRGLSAPMLPRGMDAKVTAHDREDYVGREDVQTDANGRPIMSIVTTRDDGSNDVVVFAPTAHARAEEL